MRRGERRERRREEEREGEGRGEKRREETGEEEKGGEERDGRKTVGDLKRKVRLSPAIISPFLAAKVLFLSHETHSQNFLLTRCLAPSPAMTGAEMASPFHNTPI